MDIVDGIMSGTFTQIRYSKNERRNTEIYTFNQVSEIGSFGGYIKGNLTGNYHFNTSFQIDFIIKGMAGKVWTLSIFAQSIQNPKLF